LSDCHAGARRGLRQAAADLEQIGEMSGQSGRAYRARGSRNVVRDAPEFDLALAARAIAGD
jgi:hypothetical protein